MSTKRKGKPLTWEQLCALEPSSVVRQCDQYNNGPCKLLVMRQTASGPDIVEVNDLDSRFVVTKNIMDRDFAECGEAYYATKEHINVLCEDRGDYILLVGGRLVHDDLRLTPSATLKLFKALGEALGYEVEE